jgi:broad specificity phosphatase PhoE
MQLYFLRHGEADWPDWQKSDDERPLTKRGKREMHEVGAFLARLKVRCLARRKRPKSPPNTSNQNVARIAGLRLGSDPRNWSN